MKDLSELSSVIQNGLRSTQGHNQVLQSLYLSKQNANRNPYSKETQGIRDESFQPGEGISESSSGDVA